jgi:hypothetical protein
MIIRTSEANVPSFELREKFLVERHFIPWYLLRIDLKTAIEKGTTNIVAGLAAKTGQPSVLEDSFTIFGISQGVTQRKKKFIRIGCKRFVGKSRERLIRWAKSAK